LNHDRSTAYSRVVVVVGVGVFVGVGGVVVFVVGGVGGGVLLVGVVGAVSVGILVVVIVVVVRVVGVVLGGGGIVNTEIASIAKEHGDTKTNEQLVALGYLKALDDFGIWKNGAQHIGCLEVPVKKLRQMISEQFDL